MTIRVLVVDDQEMIRDGLATMLSAAPDIEVVGLAGDGRAAVELCRELSPEVVVMDVRMPVLDGLAATAEILGGRNPVGVDPCRGDPTAHNRGRSGDPDAAPVPKVLILTTFDLDEYVYEALGAGASGFLLKDASGADLIAAVRVVAGGDALLAPTVTRRLIGDFARRRHYERPSPQAVATLTPRERGVLCLVARGLSNAEIAAELTLAEQTVKTHVGNMLTKLGLRDRTQAVVYAYENGLAG
ncbi:response regulator [Rugosimonospora africana]|uniref:DNA-binding response regulator n=1 Tax=Rugosimonospora africana TaxID=556532 RepID=A0A8J3VTE5_9ACTN|nr:response regulator transcription factor [Rugosimonospora africana]GIH17413.1 DNA-binding response regulator [Rugosimonospora africana]